MACHFIGIFEKQELVGIALSQFLDLNSLESFGERDKCLKTVVRNFVFKNFCSHVLFIGNNMLTGQNAIALSACSDARFLAEARARKETSARHGKIQAKLLLAI